MEVRWSSNARVLCRQAVAAERAALVRSAMAGDSQAVAQALGLDEQGAARSKEEEGQWVRKRLVDGRTTGWPLWTPMMAAASAGQVG